MLSVEGTSTPTILRFISSSNDFYLELLSSYSWNGLSVNYFWNSNKTLYTVSNSGWHTIGCYLHSVSHYNFSNKSWCRPHSIYNVFWCRYRVIPGWHINPTLCNTRWVNDCALKLTNSAIKQIIDKWSFLYRTKTSSMILIKII